MATEKRLIDADKLVTDIQGTESEVAKNAPYDQEWFTRMAQRQFEILNIIGDAPAVDAVEVVHGRWIRYRCLLIDEYICSECNEFYPIAHNYCPNCGAKMDGDGSGSKQQG